MLACGTDSWFQLHIRIVIEYNYGRTVATPEFIYLRIDTLE